MIKGTVLFVNDIRTTIQFFKAALEGAGFETEMVVSADDTVKLFTEQCAKTVTIIRAVLLDINMPVGTKLSGLAQPTGKNTGNHLYALMVKEAVKHGFMGQPGRPVPIAMLTNVEDPEVHEELQEIHKKLQMFGPHPVMVWYKPTVGRYGKWVEEFEAWLEECNRWWEKHAG